MSESLFRKTDDRFPTLIGGRYRPTRVFLDFVGQAQVGLESVGFQSAGVEQVCPAAPSRCKPIPKFHFELLLFNSVPLLKKGENIFIYFFLNMHQGRCLF